jgi:imidazoleglycerol-phosphate dehydratase/histidinol-phosphatase
VKNKVLFLDRDGTLIIEPSDQQVDTLEKFQLLPGVLSALKNFKAAGYQFIMVSNQDGLGSAQNRTEIFSQFQKLLNDILESEGIIFEAVRICPHFVEDRCQCRKPAVGLVLDYLRSQELDLDRSFVIGDRQTDLDLALAMGIKGIQIGSEQYPDWDSIQSFILTQERKCQLKRQTNETTVDLMVNLDNSKVQKIDTGIKFFDHMLEQFAKHSGIGLEIKVEGDLEVDEHHTIEDTALVLGKAIRQALGDKRGIERYGFVLPMDEALATVALDLSGRPYSKIDADFITARVNDFSSEMLVHFLRSLTDSARIALHVQVKGENTHHMFEAVFKCLGRAFSQAIFQKNLELPSTKGVL